MAVRAVACAHCGSGPEPDHFCMGLVFDWLREIDGWTGMREYTELAEAAEAMGKIIDAS